MLYVILTAIAAPVIGAIDFLWIGIIARGFYQEGIGHLFAASFNIPAAVAFYVVYALGLAVFVVVPAIEARSVVTAFTLGALFGFFAYAAYDLTNLATLRDWPLSVTFADMAWGAFLSAVVSAFTYSVATGLVGY